MKADTVLKLGPQKPVVYKNDCHPWELVPVWVVQEHKYTLALDWNF